jgi:hypothetical protein
MCVWPLSMTKVCLTIEYHKGVFNHWVWQRQWSNTTLSYSMSKHIFVMLNGQTHLCHTRWSNKTLSYSMVNHTFVLINGQAHLCHTQWSNTPLCHTLWIEYDIGVFDHWAWQSCVLPSSMTKMCLTVEHYKGVFYHWVWQSCAWPLN